MSSLFCPVRSLHGETNGGHRTRLLKPRLGQLQRRSLQHYLDRDRKAGREYGEEKSGDIVLTQAGEDRGAVVGNS